ncbi:MAG: hypothetical protein NC102_07245 [Clostridium sp.]|nr:hypothetical protein [Clostridium sp.]
MGIPLGTVWPGGGFFFGFLGDGEGRAELANTTKQGRHFRDDGEGILPRISRIARIFLIFFQDDGAGILQRITRNFWIFFQDNGAEEFFCCIFAVECLNFFVFEFSFCFLNLFYEEFFGFFWSAWLFVWLG